MKTAIAIIIVLVPGCVAPYRADYDLSDKEKILSAYRYAAEIEYRPDPVGDEWELPSVTERRGYGDCEDQSIWLYHQLRAYGIESCMEFGKLAEASAGYHCWVVVVTEEGLLLLDPSVQFAAYRAVVPSRLYLVLINNPYIEGKRKDFEIRAGWKLETWIEQAKELERKSNDNRN